MTSTKLDRRKQYTRMVLKDSIMKLLKEKSISTITVKEICKEADINRSTFYAHYSDQYDLLEKIEEEIIEDMITYLNQYDFDKEDETLQMTEKLLEYIVTKKDICQTLLNENVDTTFQQKVMDIVHRYLMKNWASSHLDGNVSEYFSTFIISGSIYVIKRWLKNGMDKSPKELGELVNNIINKGVAAVK
ncbi:TetR/AcrR family transcriptional regulator [Ferdinandcohnia sp. SAFN-114]|uniref:TetR/AcrR family transcriptional regulator n=1 Tax=Ferdinandcohnia sp. SAFN-114 TaxID=3387275 RepID=UPI003F7F238B